jgi:hypothetical protein
MGDRDEYEELDEDELEGAYWRWAEEAVPARQARGWSLPVAEGRIARWSVLEGERHLSVREWMYEHFCAHFDGELTINRSGSAAIRVLAEGRAADNAPLLELIGVPVVSGELTDGGDLRLVLEDGTAIHGGVGYVHCEDRVWELSPSSGGWELWVD